MAKTFTSTLGKHKRWIIRFIYCEKFLPIQAAFNGSLYKSPFTTTIKVSKIIILRKNNGAFHVDGEPFEGGKEFKFEIKEAALKVLAHTKSK